MNLDELKKEAVNELRERAKDEYPNLDDHPDWISEIADSSVPIHYADLLEMAGNEIWLATEEPEIMAFDGTNTAINAIAGNIYKALEEAMYSEWDYIVEELEDEEDAEENEEAEDGETES
jgi:hypothetical protein